MHAVILSIGDELVLGQTVDTNSAYLSERLASRGIMPVMHVTVADDQRATADAIRRACEIADLILVTGGLGPTDDDLTRQAMADVLGVPLVRDEAALREIAAFFTRRQRPMNPRNEIQAMCPVGAVMLHNPVGTAPGIKATIGSHLPGVGTAPGIRAIVGPRQATVFCLPGVPGEMYAMYDLHIGPHLEAAGHQPTLLTTKLNTFGLGESDVASLLGDLMRRDRNPVVGTTVSGGIVSVRIRSAFADAVESQRQLDDTITRVRAQLGDIVFSRDEVTLAQVVGELLRRRRMTLATAESCTGGWIGELLTQVPGASDYYRGGFITYCDDLKTQLLGVPPEVLRQQGAVSEPCAGAMAEGALRNSGADIAVSITGVAGPGGGTPDKLVGTICFGVAQRNRAAETHRLMLGGDRAFIRLRAAYTAMDLVRQKLLMADF
ncbi:MAG: nicotinamide-nucleotide amidohydrolase family protein [Phycisphaerales bacterium]